MLGFGRAVGEAIAVAQVIGGVPAGPIDLFKGGYTGAAVIANTFVSPVSTLNTSVLFYMAAILLVIGISSNLAAQRISRSFGRGSMSALGNSPGMVPNPTHALTPSGNLRRRQLTSRLFVGLTLAAAGLAVAVLLILVYYAAKNGVSQLSLSFLTAQLPAPGGIVPAAAWVRRSSARPRSS